MNSTGSGHGHDNEISGSPQRGQFLNHLRNCRLLKLDNAIISYVGSYLFSCLVSWWLSWLVGHGQAGTQEGRQTDRRSDINQVARSLAEIRVHNHGPPPTALVQTRGGAEQMIDFVFSPPSLQLLHGRIDQCFMMIDIFTIISQIIQFPLEYIFTNKVS